MCSNLLCFYSVHHSVETFLLGRVARVCWASVIDAQDHLIDVKKIKPAVMASHMKTCSFTDFLLCGLGSQTQASLAQHASKFTQRIGDISSHRGTSSSAAQFPTVR